MSQQEKEQQLKDNLPQLFIEHYPTHLIAKNPILCIEAIGYLRCMSDLLPCMKEFTQFQLTLLQALIENDKIEEEDKAETE